MSFTISIPRDTGDSRNIPLNPGEMIFVLGANGTGKSALIHKFYSENRNNTKLITAHRQIWFSTNINSFSVSQKNKIEEFITHFDKQEKSRWTDEYSYQRPFITIYNLIASENARARKIAKAFEENNIDGDLKFIDKHSKLSKINELLRLSNIQIMISIDNNENVKASKNCGQEYSIYELSDGERSALLIAANVLTAPENSLLIIDEPERHLHRSITSSLLTQLFAQRGDCAFIISTHDVTLPLDSPKARTILVRGCTIGSSTAQTWDVDLVPDSMDIDDSLKRDILGARRILLFVEGDGGSLDKPLYSLVFPQVSVIAKANCREVEDAVRAIRDTQNLQWVQAFGIIDGDCHTAADRERLKHKGIYAVPFYSVEAIYYHPEIQKRIADRQASFNGANATELFEAAKEAGMRAIKGSKKSLIECIVTVKARQAVMAQLPDKDKIKNKADINININLCKIIDNEENNFELYLKNGNFEKLLAIYPIQKSQTPSEIAKKLLFQSCDNYERAVLKLLKDETDALTFVKDLFGSLADEIAKTSQPSSSITSQEASP